MGSEEENQCFRHKPGFYRIYPPKPRVLFQTRQIFRVWMHRVSLLFAVQPQGSELNIATRSWFAGGAMEDSMAAMAQAEVCKERMDGSGSNPVADLSEVIVGKATSTRSDTSSSATKKIAHDAIVDYISEMKLIDPSLCRSVPAYRILESFGRVLRLGRVSDSHFGYSSPACRIRKFVSHSWHAAVWFKVLSLLLVYNLKAAAVAGQTAACLMMVLFSFGKLPGFAQDVRFDPEPLILAPLLHFPKGCYDSTTCCQLQGFPHKTTNKLCIKPLNVSNLTFSIKPRTATKS